MSVATSIQSSVFQKGITGITHRMGTVYKPTQTGIKYRAEDQNVSDADRDWEAVLNGGRADPGSLWYEPNSLNYGPLISANLARKVMDEFRVYGDLIFRRLKADGYEVAFLESNPAISHGLERAVNFPSFSVSKSSQPCAEGRMRITMGDHDRFPKIWVRFSTPACGDEQPIDPTVSHFIKMASGFGVALMTPASALLRQHFEETFRIDHPNVKMDFDAYKHIDLISADTRVNGIGVLVDDVLHRRDMYADKLAREAVAQMDVMIKSTTGLRDGASDRPLYDIVMDRAYIFNDGGRYEPVTGTRVMGIQQFSVSCVRGTHTVITGIAEHYESAYEIVEWPPGCKPSPSLLATRSMMYSAEKYMLRARQHGYGRSVEECEC